jgi:hypothetical protein
MQLNTASAGEMFENEKRMAELLPKLDINGIVRFKSAVRDDQRGLGLILMELAGLLLFAFFT